MSSYYIRLCVSGYHVRLTKGFPMDRMSGLDMFEVYICIDVDSWLNS